MIIALLIIFFLGREFYRLAHKYHKNEWGYGILGVVTYYLGTFVGAFIVGALFFSSSSDDFGDGADELVLTILSIPAGLLATWALYKHLKKKWSTEPYAESDVEILDSDYTFDED